MDVEAVQPALRGLIPQPLKRGTHQDRTAVSLVNELTVPQKPEAVGRNPLTQGGELAGDGVGVRLLLRRHPGVDGYLCL